MVMTSWTVRLDSSSSEYPRSSLNDGLVYVKKPPSSNVKIASFALSRMLRYLSSLASNSSWASLASVMSRPTAMAPNVSSFSSFSMATVRNIGKCSPFKRLPMVSPEKFEFSKSSFRTRSPSSWVAMNVLKGYCIASSPNSNPNSTANAWLYWVSNPSGLKATIMSMEDSMMERFRRSAPANRRWVALCRSISSFSKWLASSARVARICSLTSATLVRKSVNVT